MWSEKLFCNFLRQPILKLWNHNFYTRCERLMKRNIGRSFKDLKRIFQQFYEEWIIYRRCNFYYKRSIIVTKLSLLGNGKFQWIINFTIQYSQKINTWYGMLNERIIPPFIFEENMNAKSFSQLLNADLWAAINPDLPINEIYFSFFMDIPFIKTEQTNIFQTHGSSLIDWPSRSPNFTNLDSFQVRILT